MAKMVATHSNSQPRGQSAADEETSLLPASIDQKDATTTASSSSSSSSLTSWIRLLTFFIASVIAGGIMPGQNEYNRLFCEAGIFRYACHEEFADSSITATLDYDASDTIGHDSDSASSSCCPAQWLLIANTMNSLSMFVTFLFLLSGIMFDILGGRKCATLGCAILSVGFGILAVLLRLLGGVDDHTTNNDVSINGGGGGIMIKPSVETILFAMGVLTCDIGSFFVNVAFYGFLFHLPTKQALILALSNSCFSCASFLPIVVSGFMDVSGYTLPSVLLMYGVVILIGSGGVCWLTVPSLEEYHSNALVVLGLPIPRRTVKGWEGMKKQLLGAKKVLTHPDHAMFHKISMVVLAMGWVPAFVYMSMADPLGQEIFGGEGGGGIGLSLGVSFLKINTLVGLLVGPACGLLVDKFQHPSDGLIEICMLMTVSLAVVTLLCGVASWMVQIVVLIFVCISQTMQLLFAMRYAVLFSYPNRVGVVTGALIFVFGTLSLVLILLVSLIIVITKSYLLPVRIVSTIGMMAWAAYVVYIKREERFPASPTLLPEDEIEIAKNFGVSTIEDAAYVADMSPDALLKLSASTKVADLRRLSDIALSGGACERILHVARRNSSRMSSEDVQRRRSSQISIQEEFPVPDFAWDKVRKGSFESSFDCITTAFNGHGGFGGSNEPSVDWMFSAMTNDRDDPIRVEAFGSFLGPMLVVSETYGMILEVVVNDESGRTNVAASCACYPPGTLDSDGSTMKAGGDRYHFGLATYGLAPTFTNKEITGEAFVQRLAAFKQDSEWDQRRKDYGEMWYIGLLGTHPKYQGSGYGRLLLDVVSNYAQETKHDCYLECSGPNIAFYKRCGYDVLWKNEITIHGDSIVLAGMVKKYQA
mmetsp:Transcript_30492/g.61195  ORF Transcript_30492/g.61195 Transcript_30492/m.61195 type:complete len:874 (+) Transcript_30492:77-2698(+)